MYNMRSSRRSDSRRAEAPRGGVDDRRQAAATPKRSNVEFIRNAFGECRSRWTSNAAHRARRTPHRDGGRAPPAARQPAPGASAVSSRDARSSDECASSSRGRRPRERASQRERELRLRRSPQVPSPRRARGARRAWRGALGVRARSCALRAEGGVARRGGRRARGRGVDACSSSHRQSPATTSRAERDTTSIARVGERRAFALRPGGRSAAPLERLLRAGQPTRRRHARARRRRRWSSSALRTARRAPSTTCRAELGEDRRARTCLELRRGDGAAAPIAAAKPRDEGGVDLLARAGAEHAPPPTAAPQKLSRRAAGARDAARARSTASCSPIKVPRAPARRGRGSPSSAARLRRVGERRARRSASHRTARSSAGGHFAQPPPGPRRAAAGAGGASGTARAPSGIPHCDGAGACPARARQPRPRSRQSVARHAPPTSNPVAESKPSPPPPRPSPQRVSLRHKPPRPPPQEGD